MKNTTLRMGPRGTVTLPKLLREQYALGTHDLLLAESTPEGILLRPAVATAIEIYTDERIAEFAESERELEEAAARNPKLKAWLERAAKTFRQKAARSTAKS
ncbi:MAG TPA: AbrB/MazE/SpoVT family DNA-binding domain-containing protein [Opitutales bacterium]|jgi:bifunctional DNA-binding transcriptional regulator/antitoxin component of YhaV-PrlF toxin-antitoxin module|nr:AbrB/MazE/SpoVT family DNA-binding domain-containing protein [Opitutales bacterium]